MNQEVPFPAEPLPEPGADPRAAPQRGAFCLALFEHAPVGMALVRGTRFELVNACFETLFGWPAGTLDGQGVEAVWLSAKERERVLAGVRQRLARGEAIDLELQMRHRDGRALWCRLRARALPDGAAVWIVEDVDSQHRERLELERRVHERSEALASANAQLRREMEDRQSAEDLVRHLADHDPLTGLPNRHLLAYRLEQAIAAAQGQDGGVAVLFMDLDRFKAINDSLGHGTGDRLLQAVAERVRQCLRPGDTVARLGGAEFVMVLPAVAAPGEAAQLASKLIRAVSQPCQIGELELRATPSLGISLYPEHGDNPDALIAKASVAMYQAKAQGRRNYLFFSGQADGASSQRLLLEHELYRALEHNQLELLYQPRYALDGEAFVACEALLRWQHPSRGAIGPAEFVPLAEDSGLIVQIGEWVLRETCRQIRRWQDRGLDVRPVSINLSARQFHSLELISMIRSVLAETGVPPRLLEVEITETTLMHNTDETQVTLGQLSALGIKISIDDFGTGYSSLAYLKRFPVDVLKIDRSFVREIVPGTEDALIVGAIIGLARSLRLRVVAEGVETREQAEFLRREGCDEGQGFLFGQPLAAAELEPLLRRAR
ncbi:putative bifunctional diguanylate cyclase/phosphodiesterase [Caldimonas tepidiphila]|uniref:putative bifunctional diguanylate cyclase/phosphodiesterase n=1 Tax=Caldimonas tepidiphila TaxID=2315841 RepID=UPI000E5C27CC|nr:EAL domain-containing protein [Caldimonas tepidiphila]